MTMPRTADTAVSERDRRRAVQRTAFWLALTALAVYVGFIVLSVARGH
jgi:hypothetical protein